MLADDAGRNSEIALISPLESEGLLSNLRLFIYEIGRLKENRKGIKTNELLTAQDSSVFFQPEKEGRRPYTIKAIIEADLIHARVVNELSRQLQLREYKVTNTLRIDLMMVYRDHTISHLFEVKSDCDSQSVFTAIGQLMYHSLAYPSAKRILVLPYGLNTEFEDNIRKLKIRVLNFEITQQGVRFSSFANAGCTYQEDDIAIGYINFL